MLHLLYNLCIQINLLHFINQQDIKLVDYRPWGSRNLRDIGYKHLQSQNYNNPQCMVLGR